MVGQQPLKLCILVRVQVPQKICPPDKFSGGLGREGDGNGSFRVGEQAKPLRTAGSQERACERVLVPQLVRFAIVSSMKIILVDAIHTFVIEGQGMFKEMYDLLETYPNRKIVLTGATNERFKEFGLDKLPYEVFTLKQNPPKTNPDYFKIMLKHFGLANKDVVYLEHSPEAVKSAESIGIISYHYDKEKKDLANLKRFLDKNLS